SQSVNVGQCPPGQVFPVIDTLPARGGEAGKGRPAKTKTLMEVHGSLRCPSCGHGNRRNGRHCTECGARLPLSCPSCGAPCETGMNFCGLCGARLAAAVPLEAEAAAGERRQLTVLFCDLVGSTPLSQQLDAEEWRDLLAQYQQAASGAVGRFGGHVARK